LEDYDDYAKQARLYTKIHAKSGKSEFERLLQQQQQQQQQKASSVNKVAAADTTCLETPIVSAKSIDTELDKQQPSPMTSPHNVLTTSMVSNTVGITVGDTNGAAISTALDNGVSELKRSSSSETNRPTKQARLDDENTGLDGTKNSNNGSKKMAPLTHTQPPKDKKKRSLRRL
jgi:ubiquitin-conjugating enzyme E2 S